MQVILNGFMGTGKTTIGKILAHRLDCPFYDLDLLIEQDQGKTIAEIFASRGEAAFRKMEEEKLADLLEKEGVIALGGGVLTNPENMERVLSGKNLLVGLCCSASEIMKRVELDGDIRPLLHHEMEEPALRIQKLLEQRKAVYNIFDIQIDTTTINPDQAALLIEQYALIKMERVRYPGGTYPIWMGRNLLHSIGELIRLRSNVKKITVVTNKTVAGLYLEPVLESIREQGMDVSTVLIPDGEDGKNLETISEIYSQLAEMKADRSSMLLALGGGITGDVCGFAAATYMRGIPFIQVPTTLLAMVDSSIGGKTGVNIAQGKNLVGSFKQPDMVIMDFDTLQTLPDQEILNGFGEFIKHGLIASSALVEQLSAFNESVEKIIYADKFEEMFVQSLSVKQNLVQIDPFEANERMMLNFGHTLGHAIEKASSYQVSHGEAVIIGMWFAVLLSVESGALPEVEFKLIDQLYQKYALPRALDNFMVNDIKKFIAMDKKKNAGEYRWILLKHIGEAFITSFTTTDHLDKVMTKLGAKL